MMMIRGTRTRILMMTAVLCLWGTGAAHAQKIPAVVSKNLPVVIEADQGLEWNATDRTYSAKGNAMATQGDKTIRADTLTAFARAGDDSDIDRVEADGNVRLITPTHEGFGDHGVYDMATSVARLTGQNVRLQSSTDTVTARDVIEFHQNERVAYARGEATVTRQDKTLRADQLKANFVAAKDGNLEVNSIQAAGNIKITTPTDTAYGDTGTYTLKTGLVTLAGNVRIVRGGDHLAGDMAEVNLNTGVSRLLSKQGGGRVKGVFSPKKKS